MIDPAMTDYAAIQQRALEPRTTALVTHDPDLYRELMSIAPQDAAQPATPVPGVDGAEREREASGGALTPEDEFYCDIWWIPTAEGLRAASLAECLVEIKRLRVIADAAREWADAWNRNRVPWPSAVDERQLADLSAALFKAVRG